MVRKAQSDSEESYVELETAVVNKTSDATVTEEEDAEQMQK